MSGLNELIANDTINLGKGFRIGHSFFVPDKMLVDPETWYRQVVETEIRPLLEEYWLDDAEKAESLCGTLLEGVP